MKKLPFLLCMSLPVFGWAQLALARLSEELIFANPPFEECHAATLAECAPQKLMLTFYGGSPEAGKDREMAIWLVKQNSKKWTRPFRLAGGAQQDSIRYHCSNPVLFRAGSGKMFLFYQMGSTPDARWGMVRTSVKQGRKWQVAKKLPAGVLGPSRNRPAELQDGTIMYVSSAATTANHWRVHIQKSCDQGKNWSSTCIDSACLYPLNQPNILSYQPNKLQFICRGKENRLVQCWSEDNSHTWGKLDSSYAPDPDADADAITLRSGWQILVYRASGALTVALSRDGLQWNDALQLEDDRHAGDCSFPSLLQTQDGKIHVTYSYQRKNIKHIVLQEQVMQATAYTPLNAVNPPSTGSITPVIKLAASEQRN